MEPHDYRIYFVNIDLRHQHGISVAESQTSLRAKRPQWRRARRNGCLRRLVLVQFYKAKRRTLEQKGVIGSLMIHAGNTHVLVGCST